MIATGVTKFKKKNGKVRPATGPASRLAPTSVATRPLVSSVPRQLLHIQLFDPSGIWCG